MQSGETIRVDAGVLAAVRAHAASAWPEECCGALVGRVGQVVRSVPLKNESIARRRQRYRIGARAVLAVEEEAASEGLDVVGFYHSHPAGVAVPSEVDLAHAWPGYVYLIAAVGRGRAGAVGCWRLCEDRSDFLPVRIVEPGKEYA